MRQPTPRRTTVIRYLDQFGTQVPKGTPGARRVKTRTDTYSVRIAGKRYSLDTTDLAVAHQTLNKLLRRLRDEELGISTPQQSEAAKPLTRHVEDFVAFMRAKGTGQQECRDTRSQLLRLAGLAGWRLITDVTKDSCLLALEKVVSELGRSQQTRNHYLRRAKAFAAWLTDADPPRLARDPLRKVKALKVTEFRHKRRVPTDDEIALLMRAIDQPAAKVRMGMSGSQRALAYRLCMATGFRAGELRSLTRQSFDLDTGTVRLEARSEKNRSGTVQPLPPWLVLELRAWFAGGGRCWERFPKEAGRLLEADLAVAGVPYKVEVHGQPIYFDFHSLRHWFVSWAANSPGISPKTLQVLARHSTAQLTIDVYAKAQTREIQATIASLPDPSKISVAKPVAADKTTEPDRTEQTGTGEDEEGGTG